MSWWSKEEKNIITTFYGKISNSELLGKLHNKTRFALHNKARALGLTKKPPKLFHKMKDKVLFLHSKGYIDQAIANELGFSRTSAVRYRKKLGLPKNINTEFVKNLRKTQFREKCKRYGVTSLNQLKKLNDEKRAASDGYSGCTDFQCWIIKFLSFRPRSLVGLADDLGISRNCTSYLHTNLKKLVLKGMLVKNKVSRKATWDVVDKYLYREAIEDCPKLESKEITLEYETDLTA